jgi:hypothetical protein
VNILGKAVGMLLLGIAAIDVLNKIATDPRISPMWRFLARTAEGDVYQHVVSGALMTVLA